MQQHIRLTLLAREPKETTTNRGSHDPNNNNNNNSATMSANGEEFKDASELKVWLEGKGVREKVASATASTLFEQGFDTPSTLLGISTEQLVRSGLSIPSANELSNALSNALRTQEIAETTANLVLEKMEIKSSSIKFGSVDTKQFAKVSNTLRFKIKGASWKHKGHIPETNTQPHTWLDGNEDSPENIKEYMDYINEKLKQNFWWKDEHEFVDCNQKGLKNLLSTHHFDGQHSTSGNIDVVLVAPSDKAAMTIKNNIELGIELKHTNIKGEHERQVIMQHLAASFLNERHPALTLMSDLNTRFNFYWFGKSEKIILKYKASISEAIYLLEHMFCVKNDAGRGDGDEEETFPTDFLIGERGTWESFSKTNKMDSIREGGNENGSGDADSPGDANHQKQEKDIAGKKRDNTGNPVDEKNEEPSSSGGRNIGINHKVGIDDLSDVLGFDVLEEHEKGEAVLEYIACNVLPNVVLTSSEQEASIDLVF